jgi:nitrite reductase/ring-hydroxylating ferredoxin subunit
MATIEVNGRQVVLLKVGGGYRAIDRACPHEEGDLSEGLMFGPNIKCPVHGFIYDLTTGRCLNQRGYHAQVYEVEVREGTLLLRPKSVPGTAPEAPPD